MNYETKITIRNIARLIKLKYLQQESCIYNKFLRCTKYNTIHKSMVIGKYYLSNIIFSFLYTLYNFYINLKIPVKKVSLQFLEFILFNNKNISVKKKSVINNFNKSISSQKALKERTARIFSRDVIARICRNEYAKSWSFLDLRKARKAIWNEIETKPWLPAWLTRLRPYWERFVRSFVPTHLQRIDLARQCCSADSSTTRDRFHVRKSISHLSRIIEFCTEISKLIAFFFLGTIFSSVKIFIPPFDRNFLQSRY